MRQSGSSLDFAANWVASGALGHHVGLGLPATRRRGRDDGKQRQSRYLGRALLKCLRISADDQIATGSPSDALRSDNR